MVIKFDITNGSGDILEAYVYENMIQQGRTDKDDVRTFFVYNEELPPETGEQVAYHLIYPGEIREVQVEERDIVLLKRTCNCAGMA